jgi:copper(I)-binding protein
MPASILPSLLAALMLPMAAPVGMAQETADGALVVERPWARASIGTSRPGAAYFTVRNDGAEDDVLKAIETPAAHMAELHTTEVRDGVATMGRVEALEIPAGTEATLAPGGTHVMLMMLTAPLKEGQSLPMTLVFERSGRIAVEVPVFGIGSSGPAE